MTEATPGKPVRVQLTLTGGDSLARFVGPDVASIDGRLVIAADTGIEVGVKQVTMHGGLEQYWKGETVEIPKQYVSAIQERKFSWAKTGLLAGVVILLAASLKGTGALGSSGSGGGGGGGQQ
jgi:hypothetical protein